MTLKPLTAFLQFLNALGLKRKSNDRIVTIKQLLALHVVEGSSGKPLNETPAGKLGTVLSKGICPDCGSKNGFYEGPSGGMSTNIFCANPECRSGFNYTPMFGESHAERIGKGPDSYYD